jgi:peptide/nickel transport system permease protein
MRETLIDLARRAAGLALTMLVVSFLVFLTLEFNVEGVAVKVLGQFSTPDQRHAWLVENGYLDPFLVRYARWLGDFVQGHWGTSTYYREDILKLILPRLAASGLLAGSALLVMIPLSLVLGVAAGAKEGSALDRSISLVSIITTSIPEFATAVFLSAVFVIGLGWLPGVSTMAAGVSIRELVLPVSVLALASTGYIARMTRASMAEVMAQPYIRMAKLKGASPSRIILRHALRNALITPVTVIMLQIPWILSGAIVVEVFFAYRGFGGLLYQASLNADVYLVEACAMVSVMTVVVCQTVADLIYVRLDPRLAPGGGRRA